MLPDRRSQGQTHGSYCVRLLRSLTSDGAHAVVHGELDRTEARFALRLKECVSHIKVQPLNAVRHRTQTYSRSFDTISRLPLIGDSQPSKFTIPHKPFTETIHSRPTSTGPATSKLTPCRHAQAGNTSVFSFLHYPTKTVTLIHIYRQRPHPYKYTVLHT